MNRLEGKVAFVTGAGSGIGRQIALRFAQEGALVTVADRLGDRGRETVDLITTDGGKAVCVTADVTSAEQVDAALSSAVSTFGGLDVIVNNAGVDIVGEVTELSELDWRREIDINLTSAYIVSKAAWPHLTARGGGAILNTASVAGLRAIADNVGYCVSKAGVIMLTQCLALSGAPEKIRANCVSPGFTDTGMIAGYFSLLPDPEAARAGAQSLHPLGRFGRTKDIADGFVYLASDEAEWVTGTNLVIDGGLTSRM